jgi:hypothetical protein
MVLALCIKVGSMSFFRGSKRPKVDRLVVDPDARTPSVRVIRRKDACKTGAVPPMWSALVFDVHLSGDAAEVVKPIVGRVAVNVVNIAFGPFSVSKQPSQAVQIHPLP